MNREQDAIVKLKELHSFNKLDNIKVEQIGKDFNVDAFKLCDDYGISYEIKKERERLKSQNETTK